MKKILIFAISFLVLTLHAMEDVDFFGFNENNMIDVEAIEKTSDESYEPVDSTSNSQETPDGEDADTDDEVMTEFSNTGQFDSYDDVSLQMLRDSQACQCGFSTSNQEALAQHISSCSEFKKTLGSSLAVVNIPNANGLRVIDPSTPATVCPKEIFLSEQIEAHQAELPRCKDSRKRTREFSKHKRSVSQKNKKARLDKQQVSQPMQQEQCPCGLCFDTQDQLKDHLKVAHFEMVNNKKFYFCPKKGCPKKPDQRVALILAHIASKHSNNKKYNLAQYVKRKVLHKACACGQEFDTGDLLADHIKSTHVTKVKKKTYYLCPVKDCEKNSTADLLLLLDHFASKHTKEEVAYECRICFEKFKGYELLKKHERSSHNSSEKKSEVGSGAKTRASKIADYKRCACGKKFNDGVQLSKHVKKNHVVRKGKKIYYVCPKKGCKKTPELSLPRLLAHFAAKHRRADAINGVVNSVEKTNCSTQSNNCNPTEPIQKKRRTSAKPRKAKKTVAKKRKNQRNYFYKKCVCNITFQTSEQLIDHVKSSHSIKQRNRTVYVCPLCNFYETQTLRDYLSHTAAKHTKERPFPVIEGNTG